MKKTLASAKTGADVITYCEHLGCETEPGNGSHTKIKNPSHTGKVTVPKGELQKGIKHAIIKQLLAIGISCLFIFVIINYLV